MYYIFNINNQCSWKKGLYIASVNAAQLRVTANEEDEAAEGNQGCLTYAGICVFVALPMSDVTTPEIDVI